MPDFTTFGLSPQVMRSIREMGFEEPTPVQAMTLPPLLTGKDVVAQALTGTGKKLLRTASRWWSISTRILGSFRRWCYRRPVSLHCR